MKIFNSIREAEDWVFSLPVPVPGVDWRTAEPELTGCVEVRYRFRGQVGRALFGPNDGKSWATWMS